MYTSLVGGAKMPSMKSKIQGEFCKLRNKKVGYGAIPLK